jgi:hypothetical protein
MNKLFFVFLLAGLALPGFGQGRDTVFAVHKLFLQKRASGKGLEAASDSAASKALYERYSQRTGPPRTPQEARQDALASSGFAIASALKAGQYSIEEEIAIIRRYEAGKPLPANIRRKLKRKHFHRTTRDVLDK